MEVSVRTEEFELLFEVEHSNDFIDTDRGVKVESCFDAREMRVLDHGGHEVHLPRAKRDELFEEFAEEAEQQAMEQYD